MDKYEKMIEMNNASKEKKNKSFSSPKIKERNFTPSISTILLTFIFCLIFYYSTQNIIYDLYKNQNDGNFIIQNNRTKTHISEKNKNIKEIREEKEEEEQEEEEEKKEIIKKEEKKEEVKKEEKKEIVKKEEKKEEKKKEEKKKEEKKKEEKKKEEIFPNNYYKNSEELLIEYKKAKIYFDTCMKGELIQKNRTFIKSDNPNISVVIPVYNSQNIIKPVIRSIQNQNFTNLEIILVNDFSTDNSKKVIEELQKEDPRIRLLNNENNMGTLYSRSVGSLAVKGKYIFPLDNDDLFYDETIFDVVYKEAINGNFDIVEFKAVEHTNYKIETSKKMKDSEYSNHKNNLVLYQPELGRYPRIRNNKYGVYDCFLWAKCIKSDIYKKALNKIGEKNYSLRIIWGEDLITSFALFRMASSFKFIGKYGIFHYKSKKTASSNIPIKLYALSIVLYLNVVYDFTSNSIADKKYAVNIALVYFKNSLIIRVLNNEQKKFLNSILQKYLKSKFIDELDKNRIRTIFNKYSKLGIVIN